MPSQLRKHYKGGWKQEKRKIKKRQEKKIQTVIT